MNDFYGWEEQQDILQAKPPKYNWVFIAFVIIIIAIILASCSKPQHQPIDNGIRTYSFKALTTDQIIVRYSTDLITYHDSIITKDFNYEWKDTNRIPYTSQIGFFKCCIGGNVTLQIIENGVVKKQSITKTDNTILY